MADEWVDWHRRYDQDAQMKGRLLLVQARIREALDRQPPGPVQVISVCAGDGRDLIGALEGHPRARDVRARLVEISPELVARGRERLARVAAPGLEFVQGDASTTDAFAGAVPADLVLLCGIFGNVTDEDIHGTVRHVRELARPRATVVWTRGRFAPDLTPTIRQWFGTEGFAEVSFDTVPDTTASVGVHRLEAEPRPYRPGVRLFTFLEKVDRPSERARRPG